MGFAANLMMKARSLKEGVTEKSQSGGFSLGNVQVGVLNPAVVGVTGSFNVICSVSAALIAHVLPATPALGSQ